ncbi:hypothetical protein KBX50_05205 [Micromonospora sp. C51]|uniref:hypothetical protein n=1 Tax=Micromonospora sp. C51 TaxID=2824879 RepID=UPI001B39724B|nr:hypothetical protein [Micromonospora sp. C51]MBQ1047856.1 hypothetical protein [Micromonospora sp. C51]
MTITVIRPPGRDAFGDPLPGTAIETLVPGCLFAPGPSTENQIAAMQVDSDATIYAPPGVDVRPTDRIRVRGEVYEVAGKPQDWGRAGVVILLRQVTG